MPSFTFHALLAAAAFFAPAIGSAQAPPPSAPLAFEIVSVKPNASQDFHNMRSRILPGGNFSATDVPLRLVIAAAYNVSIQSPRLEGGPEWLISERYDIEAKAPAGAVPPDLSEDERGRRFRAMLQALLADRFKLVIRHETKELSAYALVVGKNGPKMKKATVSERDCPDVTDLALMQPPQGVVCHAFLGGMGRGLRTKAASMADLAHALENWADRPIVDQTGLTGMYEFETPGWTPMRGPIIPPGTTPVPPPGTPTATDGNVFDPVRPTMFTVMEQLGLELKRAKAPVDIFVIESVQHPSPN